VYSLKVLLYNINWRNNLWQVFLYAINTSTRHYRYTIGTSLIYFLIILNLQPSTKSFRYRAAGLLTILSSLNFKQFLNPVKNWVIYLKQNYLCIVFCKIKTLLPIHIILINLICMFPTPLQAICSPAYYIY